jgi:FkbM family methyltransferase
LLYDAGKTEEAAGHYRKAIEIDPADAEGHFNLGNALKTLGRLAGAIEEYSKTVALQDDFIDAYINQGLALKTLGQLDAAIQSYEKALRVDPESADLHNNLGNALKDNDRTAEAITHYHKAIEIDPDYAQAHYNLGLALEEQNEIADAITAYRQALSLKPDFVEAHSNLGTVLLRSGELSEALAEVQTALALKPDSAEAYNNLGSALQAQGKLTEAIAAHREALALRPEYAEAHSNLGNALYVSSNLPEAIVAYRQALRFKPDFTTAHSNLLFCLHYRSDSEPAAVLAEHQRFAEHYALPLARTIRPHTNTPDPERRLRVGYLSADFRGHSVAFFIEPILRAHDRDAIEVICYAILPCGDDVTERLQALGHTWRDITRMSDAQAAELIREDEVDILIDLAGHSGENRILIFARKPAPVQVSYLGYPDTTGLSVMDYRLTDAWADPPGQTERFHTEELLRLPGGFLCYRPTPDSPDVAPPPALTAGYVTFASLNSASKVSPELVTVWSSILQALPTARLIMKAPQLSDPGVRRYFESLFADHGIAPARVEILGPIPSRVDHLGLYNRVDIGLDPFPYNGTTTTCEALWMGVPVITLAGRTHAGRVGVSLLSSIGLPELIAQAPAAYVEQALALANDLERLAALRASLRETVAYSALTDATRFTRSLEAAYRQAWQRWCEQQSSSGAADADRETAAAYRAARTSEPAAGGGSLAVRIHGDIDVCLPHSLDLLTPYVLLEQEDWFEDEIAFVRALLEPGMQVIDIGANYGVYALTMAKAVGPAGRVWAFEPASAPVRFLEQSIARNHFTNIVLSQTGLSNRTGSATLKISANSEYNALLPAGESAGNSEAVELRTLDECAETCGWDRIDFIKMDAEGEEYRIVEEGGRFLGGQSPLIMFELKHGDELNLSLLQQLKDIGYALYRLIPGLNMLAPFDLDEQIDSYQLNLFACKADRAHSLERRGLLVRGESPAAPLGLAAERTWPEFLRAFPYARRALEAWRAPASSPALPGTESYHQALDHYACAHTAHLPAAVRYHCLKQSMTLLLEVTQPGESIGRSQSLARVAWEMGERTMALDVLEDVIEQLNHPRRQALAEPFLAVTPRFDLIDPGEAMTQWCLSATLEQQERLRAFSSYFFGTLVLERLEKMKELSYYGAEMERRRQLIRMRHGMQRCPEPHPALTRAGESPRNPTFWGL